MYFCLSLFAVEVTKVTSWESELPLSYYEFKFCEPKEGKKPSHKGTNLGTVLEGIRPFTTPYEFRMQVRPSKPAGAMSCR